MTYYAAHHYGPNATLPKNVRDDLSWHPVLNVKDEDEALQMCCSRMIRQRGGVRKGEHFRFTVLLRQSLDNTPLGNLVRNFEMEASKP